MDRRRFVTLLATGVVASGTASAVMGQADGRPPIAELTRRLQQKYDAIRDFSATFLHVYEGGLLRKKATERGTVLIKKPGMMRWTYTEPEAKEFVSDGVKMYSYIPQDRQVIVADVPAGAEATSPVLFLAGRGRLSRDFAVDYAELPDAPPDTYVLKLVPNERQPEYEWLILVVDRSSLSLRGLVTVDFQGGRSIFTFSRLKENVGLKDAQFVFKIPRGVDVVTDASRPR